MSQKGVLFGLTTFFELQISGMGKVQRRRAGVFLEKLVVAQRFKKFSHLLWVTKVHYRVHISPKVYIMLGKMKSGTPFL